MARTHSHLTPFQFTKAKGAPGFHREGKSVANSPQKAVETPVAKPADSLGNKIAGNSVGNGRRAAIAILLQGATDTTRPSQTKHEIRKAPATGQAGHR